MENKQLTPEEIYQNFVGWYPEDGCIEAMEEYACQKTAALQARVVELEEGITDMRKEIHERQECFDASTKTLQDAGHKMIDRIAGLEREWKQLFSDLENEQTRTANLYSENLRLMGLLEESFLYERVKSHERKYDRETARRKAKADWQSYCREHGLTIQPAAHERTDAPHQT